MDHTVKLILVGVGVATALGTILSGLPNWGAALTPSFVGGALIATATAVGALYAEKPSSDK